MSIDFFAIDQSSGNFKLVHLVNRGNRFTLEIISSVNQVDQNKNTFENLFDMPVDFLKFYLRKINLSSQNCVLTLPESKVSSRFITIPQVSEDEVESTIYFAFKPLISQNIDTQNISYIKLFDNVQNNTSSYYVVSVDSEMIQKYYDYFEKAGINLLAVETEPLSNSRVANHSLNFKSDQDYIIVDFGAETTTMTVNNRVGVIYSQQFNFGSNSLTKLIAADLGIEIGKAELIKIQSGFDASVLNGKLVESMKPIIDSLVEGISNFRAYHKDKLATKNNLTTALLTGGGASLKFLDQYLTQNTGLQFSILNPISNIEISKKIPSNLLKNTNLNRFSAAIGANLKQD